MGSHPENNMTAYENRLIDSSHRRIFFCDPTKLGRPSSTIPEIGPMATSAAAASRQNPQNWLDRSMARFRQTSIMNDMERIERDMLRVSDEPLQVRVETFNSLMFEFLSKYGSPGIQERLGKLLNKD
jgi:hypothetical protein